MVDPSRQQFNEPEWGTKKKSEGRRFNQEGEEEKSFLIEWEEAPTLRVISLLK